MPLFQVVVLAMVQGLTEFLPVSSTAHLYLTSWLLGWQTESLYFDIMLHIGTLLALVLYFLRDWMQIVAQGLGMSFGPDNQLKHNRMLLWLLVIGTVPVGVAGALFNKQAESTWRTPWVMGVDARGHRRADVDRRKRRPQAARSGFAQPVGCRWPSALAQALAVVPGTFAQRHHHQRRAVPQPRPGSGRACSPSCSPRRPSPARPAKRCGTCTSSTAARLLNAHFMVAWR